MNTPITFKKLAAIGFSFSLFFSLQAQQPVQDLIKRLMPQPVPSSPNVAALGKFGDYGVSYFTGLPDISIPIVEVKSGRLSIPITLSYHASGIKPTDVAGWVGLGWALSAGGQVSRNVKGKPDEQGFNSTALNTAPSVCSNYYYLQFAAKGTTDTEPDIFNYSFPGKNGKFMLPYNAPPFLIPYAPVKIVPSAGFGKFEITDERGVLYRFGLNSQGVSSTEYTVATNGGNPSLTATTAWHLMEVIAPNSDDQISLAYQDVGTSTTHDISYSYVILDQCYSSNGGVCPPNFPVQPVMNNDSYVNQQGLQTITFKTGKVDFILGGFRSDKPQLKSLDRINIYSIVNGNYVLQKAVKFVYNSYFTNVHGGNQELKLDAVQFLDNAGAVIEQYRFTYFTNSFSWDAAYTSTLNARDLWGYYNGATANTDLLLPTTVTFQQTSNSGSYPWSFGGAADRTVHSQYIKEGVLSRIDFPTGGYTLFDYESNQYLDVSTPTAAGGLRVKTITSYDGSGAAPVLKTYKYGSGESGNGVANFSSSQFNYNSTQMIYSICDITSPISNYQSRTFFSNIYSPEDGSPVMYPYVTEYFGDPAGATIGKTIYEYDAGSPPRDVDHVVAPSTKYYRNSFAWQRGKMTHKTVYDNAGNKVSETAIQYVNLNQSAPVVGIGAYQFIAGDGGSACSAMTCVNEASEWVNGQTYAFWPYSQNTGVMLESQVTETNYENGSTTKAVVSQKLSTYESVNLQVTQATALRANSTEQSVTVNNYPFQLSANAASTGAAQGVYMLNSKHILSSPIETFTYLQNTDLTNQRVVSGQVTAYRQNASNANYVVPDQIYLWESAATVPKASYTQVAINGGNNGLTMDANQKPRVNLVNYDNKGNVQIVSKTNDVQVSYKYGYNKALPICEVKNAQNTQYLAMGIQAISVSGTWPGTIQTSVNFTSDYTGTVYLKLGVTGSPSYTTNATLSGLTSGTITLPTGGCGLTLVTLANVPAGPNSITITLTTPNTGVSSLSACGEVDYPKNTQAGMIEFLYEGFEEITGGQVITNASAAHSGSNYLNGDYVVFFTMPNGRSYIIEYWYWDGTVWQYITKPYAGTSMTLAEGSAIDDVRIYPIDAQMKSYTYDPVLGIRSVIDESSRTYLYEYDTFGRLARIRNDKGGIEKQYTYNYKGN